MHVYTSINVNEVDDMLLSAVRESSTERLLFTSIITIDYISQDDFIASVAWLGAANFVGSQSGQDAVATHVVDQSKVRLHQLAQNSMVSS